MARKTDHCTPDWLETVTEWAQRTAPNSAPRAAGNRTQYLDALVASQFVTAKLEPKIGLITPTHGVHEEGTIVVYTRHGTSLEQVTASTPYTTLQMRAQFASGNHATTYNPTAQFPAEYIEELPSCHYPGW